MSSAFSVQPDSYGAFVAAQKRKRKKGRPETTGEHHKAKQRWAEQAAAALAEKEREEERRITDDSFPLRQSKSLASVGEKMEEMDNLSILAISAEAIKYADVVARVAQNSSNLKGTAVRELNKAAIHMRAALTSMAVKAQQLSEEGETAKLINGLNHQVSALKADNLRLVKEVESYRDSLSTMEKKKKRWKG